MNCYLEITDPHTQAIFFAGQIDVPSFPTLTIPCDENYFAGKPTWDTFIFSVKATAALHEFVAYSMENRVKSSFLLETIEHTVFRIIGGVIVQFNPDYNLSMYEIGIRFDTMDVSA